MRTMCNQRLDSSRLYEVVAAIIVVVCLGCSEATSPVEPSPSSVQSVKEFSLFGMVHDTAFRPVADVRIDVVEGVRAGVFAITDASGRYALPGMFSDGIVVRATKAGYVAVTKTYETAYPGPQALSFTMDLVAASTSIGGEYVASFTADGACTELPDIARARTYRATITRASWSPSPNQYQAILSGATFYPSTSNDRFVIGVARTFARFEIDFDGIGIAEEISPSTFVSIVGSGGTTVTGPQMVVPLDGWFEYCPGPGAGPGFYRCAVTPVTCRSANHRLTLTQRQ